MQLQFFNPLSFNHHQVNNKLLCCILLLLFFNDAAHYMVSSVELQWTQKYPLLDSVSLIIGGHKVSNLTLPIILNSLTASTCECSILLHEWPMFLQISTGSWNYMLNWEVCGFWVESGCQDDLLVDNNVVTCNFVLGIQYKATLHCGYSMKCLWGAR